MSGGANFAALPGADADRSVLKQSRMVVVALVFGTLALTGISGLLPPPGGGAFLVLPAATIGAVSPVLGYRAYLWLRDRTPSGFAPARCRETFLRANVIAFAITDAAATFGIVVHFLTGSLLALIGVAMHVLLAGALWPSDERLAAFLDRATRGGPGE